MCVLFSFLIFHFLTGVSLDLVKLNRLLLSSQITGLLSISGRWQRNALLFALD